MPWGFDNAEVLLGDAAGDVAEENWKAAETRVHVTAVKRSQLAPGGNGESPW